MQCLIYKYSAVDSSQHRQSLDATVNHYSPVDTHVYFVQEHVRDSWIS